MGSINRATLPQAFLDSVSAAMMLPQPEPQYWFARAALGNQLRAEGIRNGNMSGLGYIQSIMGTGGVPDALDSMVRAADAYPESIKSLDEHFGEGMGTLYKFKRRVFEGGGYTEASREVTMDSTTSTTGKNIQMEEVEVQLKQFEGPYDTTASAVAPYAISDFDKRWGAMALRDGLTGEVFTHLMRDRIKWLDTVLRDRFRSTDNITFADASVTSVSSYTSSAGFTANLEMIKRARKSLADREWAPFANGRYILLVPSEFDVQMLNDLSYRQLSKNLGDGRNQIFGAIGSIHNVDIFECTTLKTYAATDSVPNDTTVPSGATVYECLMFGPGTVGRACPSGTEAFYADDTNYSKVAKVIWRAAEALQTLDKRGIQRILFQNAS